MKKLLFILGILFSLGASAQTMVYDTTVVKSPLGVVKTGGAVKDSLYIQAATTSTDGYMTATAMNQLTALVGGATAYPAGNTQTGSTYTLVTGDFNKLVSMTTGGVSTITLPAGLPNGWRCTVLQAGGVITFAAANGVTIRSPFNYRRSQTQWGVITIICQGSNTFSLSGSLKQ
jgi:hypothetical protein